MKIFQENRPSIESGAYFDRMIIVNLHFFLSTPCFIAPPKNDMSESENSFLSGLQNGSDESYQVFWDAYFAKVCRLAKNRMGHLNHSVRDEEDIALSAMKSFWLAIGKKEDKLADRTELWKLLVTITKRKIIREAEKQYAGKRNINLTSHESSNFSEQSNGEQPKTFDQTLPGNDPLPELILEGNETLERIVALPDKCRSRCLSSLSETWVV